VEDKLSQEEMEESAKLEMEKDEIEIGNFIDKKIEKWRGMKKYVGLR
jgi:hypothetical protein